MPWQARHCARWTYANEGNLVEFQASRYILFEEARQLSVHQFQSYEGTFDSFVPSHVPSNRIEGRLPSFEAE